MDLIFQYLNMELLLTSSLFSKTHKKTPTYLEHRKEIDLQVNAFHFVIPLVNSAKPKERCFKYSYVRTHDIILEYILYFNLISSFQKRRFLILLRERANESHPLLKRSKPLTEYIHLFLTYGPSCLSPSSAKNMKRNLIVF